ncbi:oxygen-independent coproporphyrinogen III oxidase, partial [Thioclava sp. BHET1]
MRHESQLSKLGLFDARVPRYTSYPTAPQFSSDIGAADSRGWIRAIPAGSRISLYLHVPFCRRLCWFCACRTQGTSAFAPLAAYAETLKAELALLKAELAPGITLSRLHWGGGTPTLLPADLISELAEEIFAVLPAGPETEFSVEIDPNEIDAARLDALAAAGMNRASIGVQDFDPDIQAVIGRVQSYEITRDAAEAIRARGIRSLNADILFGLPHQTPERIATSVEQLLSLAPDRVALYGYAHVPWVARRQSMLPSEALPTPQERLRLFEIAAKLFAWEGYREIGIDHFARPEDGLAVAQRLGRLRRNFQGYTDDQAEVLLGIGASAISRFPQGYAQNAPGTSAHVKAIRARQFSTARGHRFRPEDRLRGRIIEALMCDFAVRTEELTTRFHVTRAEVETLYDRADADFPQMLIRSAAGLEIPPQARPLT